MSSLDRPQVPRSKNPQDRRRRSAVPVAGLSACAVFVALALAACGSSSSSSSAGSSGGASSGTATDTSSASASVPQSNGGFPPLSAADKNATGSPLTFGMISLSQSSEANFSEETAAAQAAAQYVNTKLGGINGHPIKISVCQTDGTPATSAACANKLIQQRPVAFFGDADLATFASEPLINKAGLAYIGGVGFGGPEDILPNSFQFEGGSTMLWPAIGEYAVKNLGAKKLSETVPTGNPFAAIASNLVAGAAEHGGMPKSSIKVVPLDPTAADVTPQVEAMNSTSPDAMVGVNTGTQCVALAQAKQSLGVTAKFFLPAGCADPQQIKQMGSAANGIYMPFEVWVPGDNGSDAKLFTAAMAKYSPKVLMNEFTASGFQQVMNTYEVLSKVKGAITAAAIIKAFDNARNMHNFLGPNFSCTHEVKAYPAVCDPKEIMFQYDNGTWKPVSSFFDPAAYTNPSAKVT
jgi:branched-chain amino acid transport system substrate-binding protein